ncbi:MAG: BCD family MFS transporter [Lysobacterales bacterium]
MKPNKAPRNAPGNVNSWHQFAAQMGSKLLPFADAASDKLPLGRLLRLALFQVSVGLAVVLLTGTLNRVMIIELGVPTWLVALMVALPLVFAPLRALIGFRSDHYVSALGWRRVPFVWFGTLLQFGGLAIMPFALLVLSGDTHGPIVYGQLGAGLAFLLLGAGMHISQTAGLALATDLASEEQRPQVVALLFVMLLIGMFFSALIFGWLLTDFSQLRLIKVIQGAAMITLALNLFALWKQEPRNREITRPDRPRPPFRQAWAELTADGRAVRLLVAVGLGTFGFAMQDILLEPFGGEVLGLSVSATTVLTALFALGTLAAFAAAAKALRIGIDPHRLAGYGALAGVLAFAILTLVTVLHWPNLFRAGVTLVGFGAGLFAVGTMTAAMKLANNDGQASTTQNGLALGAWGAVQATAAGLAVAAGGGAKDLVSAMATDGSLGSAMTTSGSGYSAVYQFEILLLFITLVVIGPLARHSGTPLRDDETVGLAEIPN